MRKVRLGRTNLKVSQVGFGGIPITRPSDEDAHNTIQRAIELGVNFFDSATGYGLGQSEIRIGKAIEEHRSRVIVATKTGAFGAERTLKGVKRSLRQLNTDYIDIYQLGNVTTHRKYERVMKSDGGVNGLKQAVDDGLINHIGLSTHNLSIAKDAVMSGEFDTVQVVFNLLAQEASDELLDLARENDVGVIAMKPFGAGMLKEARLAINYLLQYDNVVINPGVETIKEIEEIVNIADNYVSLSDDLHSEIEELHKQHGSRFCRHCELCLPCPNDVDIPSTIYLSAAWNLRSYEWFMRGAEKTVESWSNCNDCGQCESKCPFGVPIRELMKESARTINKNHSFPPSFASLS
jgi:predicted aldo/keto reductase-like oxidoreductase